MAVVCSAEAIGAADGVAVALLFSAAAAAALAARRSVRRWSAACLRAARFIAKRSRSDSELDADADADACSIRLGADATNPLALKKTKRP